MARWIILAEVVITLMLLVGGIYAWCKHRAAEVAAGFFIWAAVAFIVLIITAVGLGCARGV